MLQQYLAIIIRIFRGNTPPTGTSRYTGNEPRTGNFSNSRGYKLSAVSSDKEFEIFGTGRQWGAVDSKIVSDRNRHHKSSTESQENITADDKAIHTTIDVEQWHSDRMSGPSLP